jgi:molybdopterin-guanine dinucleotide biosynthesis protein A
VEATIDAVIVAGGFLKGTDPEDPAARHGKALLKLDGREMIEYIIDALRQVERVRRIVVVAPPEAAAERWTPGVDAVIPVAGGAIDNMVASFNHLKQTPLGLSDMVLLMTCDIPLITPAAINDFLDQAAGRDADLFYPVMSRETMVAAYPETKRTYGKLKEGTFTGGNIILANPVPVLANLRLIEDAFELRKSVPKLMQFLGPKFITKFLLRTLTIPEIEARVTDMIKANARVIVSTYPEMGIDVDKPADVALVTKVLAAA